MAEPEDITQAEAARIADEIDAAGQADLDAGALAESILGLEGDD